jgi:hypothetical protein
MGAKRKRGLPRNRLIQARLERGLAHRERAVEELNRFAATLRTTAPAGSMLTTLSTELEANTLGRWERGEVNPTPLNIELLCRFHNKSPAELDLLEALEHFQAAGWNFDPAARVAPQRRHPPLHVSSAADRTSTDEGQDASEPAGDAGIGEDGLTAPVRASQEEWRLVRRHLNQHRAELARMAARLYKADLLVDRAPLLTRPGWLPAQPVDLDHIDIEWTKDPQPQPIDGTEPQAQILCPLRGPGLCYDRYTSAVRYLEPPALFENRPSYRLLGLSWPTPGHGQLRFGLASYFDKLDVCEAIGHELAAAWLHTSSQGRHARTVPWHRLPFRALLDDPFDVARRAVIPAVTTLTLRRRKADGTAAFLLHWRDPGRVATAGGMYDVIPAGEFQPSSVAPWDLTNDLDLWRNVVREFSEELLGTPEHDGSCSTPIDYAAWPLFRALGQARAEGKLRPVCLGVGLDALTLAATILTAVVIDDDTFDEVFGDVVETNAEGVIVAVDTRRAAEGIPFTEENVTRLLTSEPMAPPGAACLALAWQHRTALLGTEVAC